MLDQVRIFRNLPEIRWDYRIHEQILPSVNRAGGSVRWTDIVVDHVGYQDASVRRRKLERNLRLLEMDDAERTDDSSNKAATGPPPKKPSWTSSTSTRTTRTPSTT
jgi:hypothetical protein